jgi:hypothetical protein
MHEAGKEKKRKEKKRKGVQPLHVSWSGKVDD